MKGDLAMASCDDSVLIVDDDPDTLVALSDLLTFRLRDVRVTTRQSAIAGLEALRNTCYRALIVDLRMPEMDGLTLLRYVHQVGGRTPVVMMSGVTEWGLAKRVIEAGAFAFMQKPFERGPLAETVRLAMQCHRMRERVMHGKRRLAQLSELLRRAQSAPGSSPARDHALTRMGHAVRGGDNSIARLERLITNLTDQFRPDNDTLCLLEEEARDRSTTLLATLGE
jgi:two-component system, LuxR family, response regulator FixJ